MKIGIDARAISHPRQGGLKTYSIGLVGALRKIDHPYQIILYYDRPCEFHTDDRGKYISEVLPGQIRLWGAGLREQVTLPIRSASDGVRLLHSLCNTSPIINKVPQILTLHDIIQLKAPMPYFGLSGAENVLKLIQLYAKIITPLSARKAKAIITDSEFTKSEIVNHLGVDSQKVFVSYIAAADCFFPLTIQEQSQVPELLRHQYGINKPYILGIGFDPRKNNETLFQAYYALEDSLKNSVDLVIIISNPDLKGKILSQADQFGVAKNLKIISQLSNDALRLFYGAAIMLVFISLREGFGLPPLEAMSCGTPVIASNTTSLPEVVGDAAYSVDPLDIRKISNAIKSVIQNPALQEDLRQKGFNRCKLFTWDKTARGTLSVYDHLILENPQLFKSNNY